MDPKFCLSSKTVLGLLTAALAHVIVAKVCPVLGISISPGDAQQAAETMVQGFGLIVAAYGRAQATGPLTLLPAAVLRLLTAKSVLINNGILPGKSWPRPGAGDVTILPPDVQPADFQPAPGFEKPGGEPIPGSDRPGGFIRLDNLLSVMLLGIALAVLMALCPGCAKMNASEAAVNNYVAGQEVAQAQVLAAAHDNIVKAWLIAGCGMPYDALTRNPTAAKAIAGICGAPAGTAVVEINIRGINSILAADGYTPKPPARADAANATLAQ